MHIKIDLHGMYSISTTFNVSDLSPFIVDDLDLSSSLFNGGRDYAAIIGPKTIRTRTGW